MAHYTDERKNHLQRFLRRLDLSFTDGFKTIIKNNIQEWIGFIQRFTKPEETSNPVWDISERPLLKIELNYKELKRGRKGRKKDHTEELIFYEPSMETIANDLKAPITWLIETAQHVNRLEPEVMRMLSLSHELAYDLQESSPIIQEAFGKIKELLEKGFEEPNEVLKKFQEYSFLLENSVEEIMKSYFQKAEDQSLEDLDNYLNKVAKSVQAIKEICINEKNSCFFQIKTGILKQHLMTRATEKN
jgi:dynein heavy chain, axonemal